MSKFVEKMPSDYYQCKIVQEFCDMPQVNYETPMYRRNPEKINRLTLNHKEFIEFFVRLIKPKNFLELGIQHGECTKQIIDLIPNEYTAVDIKRSSNIDYFEENYPHFMLYEMTTDEFFKKNNKIYDMIFIDACHSHEATYRDFLNAKECLVEDGFIFFHDTYPCSERWTSPSLCGDGYKTSEVIRKNHNEEFEIITIPVNPGISVARKCTKQLYWL